MKQNTRVDGQFVVIGGNCGLVFCLDAQPPIGTHVSVRAEAPTEQLPKI
jgi:hypothetical protein